MSQGFNHPAFPVDTHVHRLAQRWRLTKGKNVKITEADLKKGFPEHTAGINSIYRLFTTEESIAQLYGCDGRVCFICSEVNKGRKTPIITSKA